MHGCLTASETGGAFPLMITERGKYRDSMHSTTYDIMMPYGLNSILYTRIVYSSIFKGSRTRRTHRLGVRRRSAVERAGKFHLCMTLQCPVGRSNDRTRTVLVSPALVK